MGRKLTERASIVSSGFLLLIVVLSFSGSGNAGDPRTARYSPDYSNLFWFIQASDTHIGASGSKDSTNLSWLVTQARQNVNPSFIIVTGDLTDSTNGNWLGIPNGPYQAEWDQYNTILSTAGITPESSADFYYDIPGNHDAYSDAKFNYYRANSIQGRVTGGGTQVSFVKRVNGKDYHFMGLNTAGNTGSKFSLIYPYGDYAGLDANEMDFIRSEMSAKAPNAQLTMVFAHHPLFDTGNSSDTWVGEGIDAFLGVMDTYWGALFGYGHTHVSSEAFFIPNSGAYPGFYYFNVADMGKSTTNQYAIMAIDNNGISSRAFTVGAWPAVLITSPLDAQFGTANPYAYSVENSALNFVRALVFDSPTVTPTVRYRIDGGATWYSMSSTGTAHVYQGGWNASSLTGGVHTIEVQAASTSGTRSDTISVKVTGPALPSIGAAVAAVGKYVNGVWTTSPLKPGNKIVFRLELRDKNSALLPLSNATIQLKITNSTGTTVATLSGTTNTSGKAEATWTTTAPGKRGTGGTPTGVYTAIVTNVTASGYLMDSTLNAPKSFSLVK